MELSSVSMVESYFNLSDGHRLAVREVKKSAIRPTVFIHGNLASANWWMPVVGLASQTSGVKAFSSYVVDLLGHGSSSDPFVSAEMHPTNLAKQVNEFVSSLVLNLNQKINLVGHSAGGLISALAISAQPNNFNRCLFVSPVGPDGMKFGVGVLESFKRAQVDSKWRNQVMEAAVNTNWPNRQELVQKMGEDFLRSARGPGFWMIEQIAKQNFRSGLLSTGLSGRVLSGVHDLIVLPEDSRMLAEVLGFEFENLANFAHCPNTEDPNRFRKLMDDYFLLQDVFAQS